MAEVNHPLSCPLSKFHLTDDRPLAVSGETFELIKHYLLVLADGRLICCGKTGPYCWFIITT